MKFSGVIHENTSENTVHGLCFKRMERCFIVRLSLSKRAGNITAEPELIRIFVPSSRTMEVRQYSPLWERYAAFRIARPKEYNHSTPASVQSCGLP
jgi:hypothetical protein